MTNTERQARERVQRACDLISTAYRLESLDPRETLASVREAIAFGAACQAADIAEEASKA